MSSQVSALKRIITKEDHNKYSVILLRNTLNCATNQLVIGRDNDCNYRITSIEISRKHACIKFDDNNWHITDLQSTNGLFINGIQLKPYTPYCLINGDKISFGPQTHSEFVYQFVTDFNLEINRLNISLPIIPIRIHTSAGESTSSSSSSVSSVSTVSPPLPTNTVRFNIEPNVSGTISVTAMPTRSGANYHSSTTGSANNNNITEPDSTSRRRERKVVKQQETVNNRALVNDHEYSRSAIFIPSSGSSSRRSAKSKEKQKEMEKKRYERQREKLRKEIEALEQKKDSDRQRIKRKEEGLKRWKAELDKKEKETRKKEEEIEKMKKQLSNEQKKLMEEKNKRLEKERKDDKESRNSNCNKIMKYSAKRKVCDNTSLIESKHFGAKRQCNDVIDANPEQQLEEIFDSELTCTICHEMFVHAVNLNCSHTFCFACIEQWKHANSGKKECPICRVEIKNQNRQLVLDNLIERIVIKMKPEQREHREKLVEERKKKLVKQQQHVSRRLSSNRGVVSSYPLSSLHVILREATNASTSTESDSESNSDVSSNDEVSVIGIGFAGNYDIQSIVESDSDVSNSSAYDSSDSSSDSDSSAHHSNNINNFSDDSSVVSLIDNDDNADDDGDGDGDGDDAHSYVSLADTSDISDSSDESSNESDAESIFHIYDSTDVASFNSINSSVNSIFI